jgi:putative ABC transport system substrate-binding protein
MRRREFLVSMAGSMAAVSARAQAPPKQYRIALVMPAGSRESPAFVPFLPELGRLGDVEGQNLLVEYFSAEGHVERYADLARQVVGRNPDVIVTFGIMAPILMSETQTIPIVAVLGDPLALGLVKSLARPGGNLTGPSTYGIEVEGKRMELLKEAVPSAKRVAMLGTQILAGDAYAPAWSKRREDAAKLGISLIETLLRDATPQEIERGFADLAQQHADAVLLSTEGAFSPQAALIIRLAQENRLPAMYPVGFFTELGGLMAYTPDLAEVGRLFADYVHRILHGEWPGDIPINRATRFKLKLNLKAARAINLTVPQSLLARADEVIE